jgi:hypothetical protein
MPPKVLALSRHEIEPRLSITGLSAQDIHALLRDHEWRALESRNQQIVFLYDFGKSERFISIPAVIVGQVFGIHEAHVWKIRSKAHQTARLGDRPFALSSVRKV